MKAGSTPAPTRPEDLRSIAARRQLCENAPAIFPLPDGGSPSWVTDFQPQMGTDEHQRGRHELHECSRITEFDSC